MSQTAAHLVDHVMPHVPVRQWVLSLPIPLCLLLGAQAELVTPALQVVQRVVTRHLLGQAGLKADEGHGGAVTPIQRFGSAANLNIHLHCLVLDGVYRCDADGVPGFIEAGAPTDDELDALLHTIIARLMKMLTRRGVLVEDMGRTYPAEPDADGEEARTLRPPRPPPSPRARSRTRANLSRPGRTAPAGRGCSSASLTSTCSTARTAAAGNSRSLPPSSSGRWSRRS